MCGKFCGNLKHSERMNSGVMVVEPSETLFNDMIDKVGQLPSYTGGQLSCFLILCVPFFLVNIISILEGHSSHYFLLFSFSSGKQVD